MCKIQESGGLPNDQMGGYKTPGGVFIKLAKEGNSQVNMRKIKKQNESE